MTEQDKSASAVQVQPLRWVFNDNGWWRGEGVGFVREIHVYGKSDSEIADLKAAAQADYESYILAALTPHPEPTSAVQVTEAGMAAIDRLDSTLCNFLNNVGDEYDPRVWLPSVRRNLAELSAAYNDCHRAGVMDIQRAAALSQSQPAPQPLLGDCATEGCHLPATVHFVRGGVGSVYCTACYLKVQAIPHTQPAPQPDAKASGVEGEWVLVPREPTSEQETAGAQIQGGYDPVDLKAVYRAMIAAAPTPPTEAGVEEQEVAAVIEGLTGLPAGDVLDEFDAKAIQDAIRLLSDHNTIVERLKAALGHGDLDYDAMWRRAELAEAALTAERERIARLQEALEEYVAEAEEEAPILKGDIARLERARAALREAAGLKGDQSNG